jgi:glycosyltransferase involved in cell wall biosynthesis
MKICFVGGGRYNQPLDATSAKKFRMLNTLGSLFIIGFSNEFKPRIFKEYAQFYLLPRMPLPALRYIELAVLGQMLTFWLIVRHQIQVVVAQSPYEGFVAAPAIKLARWCGCKAALVVEVHGDFEESLFLYRKVRFRSLYRFLMRYAAHYSLERADVLRAISHSTTKQARRWAPQKTIISFPTWTDIGPFFHSSANRGNELSNAILFVGMVTPLKGIHYLISAFSFIAEEFRQSQLLIIGKEENASYAEELRQQIRKLGLDNRVRFIGHQSQAELALRMSEAAVLVLPSTSEGLGRVIIEAMATAMPVIGSDVGGIPELIKDGVNGFLIAPGDEKALAEKLRWIFNNPDRTREMGRSAHTFAQQTFSTENYVKGYRRIFQTALRH